CGNSLSFGGPSAGYMACRNEYMRQMPGRLAGITNDKEGKRAFTLTLQTREQHIRRERATSNICTNQALNALAMLVYLTLVGKQGLAKLARVSVERAHYLAERLVKIEGVSLAYTAPFFNEFLLKLAPSINPQTLLEKMKESSILAGLYITPMYSHLNDCLLVAVTERNSKDELDNYIETFSKYAQELVSQGTRETVKGAKS
ncbi:MAG: glycine dehydrogenase, partial [Cyanobacteria bacterium]|nr:glycine dehydrogenase [Cyanobacteriota bacterium]